MNPKAFTMIKAVAGVLLVVFGTNKFFHFLEMGAPAMQMGIVMQALASTDYIFPTVAVIEILAGVALILNRYVALMALALLPVMVNAFMMHLMLDIEGIAGSTLLLAITLWVMFSERSRYSALFRP